MSFASRPRRLPRPLAWPACGIVPVLVALAMPCGPARAQDTAARTPGEVQATATEALPTPSPPAPTVAPDRVVLSLDKGFSVWTADRRFGLSLGGWAHVMWTGLFQDGPGTATWSQKSFAAEDGAVTPYYEKKVPTYSSQFTTSEFQLRRARVQVKATVFRDVNAVVLLELVNSPPFLDYYLEYQPLKEIGLRAGQFKVPLSRLVLLAPWAFSSISSPLPRLEFNQDRDLGVQVQGSVKNHLFDYAVGVFNGSGKANKQDNRKMAVVGRLSTHPLGPVPDVEGDYAYSEKPLLSLGASADWNPLVRNFYVARADKHGSDQVGVDTTQVMAEADAVFMWKGLFLTGEFWYRGLWTDHAYQGKLKSLDPDGDNRSDSLGWTFQANYFLWKKRVEALGRVAMLRPVLGVSGADRWEGTGGLNFYPFGYNWQIQAEYQYLRNQVAGGKDWTGHQIRLQMLVKY
jgi:hypothetical protein